MPVSANNLPQRHVGRKVVCLFKTPLQSRRHPIYHVSQASVGNDCSILSGRPRPHDPRRLLFRVRASVCAADIKSPPRPPKISCRISSRPCSAGQVEVGSHKHSTPQSCCFSPPTPGGGTALLKTCLCPTQNPQCLSYLLPLCVLADSTGPPKSRLCTHNGEETGLIRGATEPLDLAKVAS